MEQDTNRQVLLALLRAEPITRMPPEQWQAVILFAQRHHVAPLLYWRIKSRGLDIPADELRSLREVYLSSAKRNILLYRQLATILQALQQADIPVVPLKGAFLAECVYGNLAVRPMGDVDVLVRRIDLARVESILLGQNYRQAHHLQDAIEETHHFSYMPTEAGLYVEVHWDLIESAFGVRVDMGALWKRVRPAFISGVPVQQMSPEDQILYLCIHTAKHISTVGIRAMCDLAETLRHYQAVIDWECLRQRASQWGVGRCVYVYLSLAREMLNAVVSEIWLDSFKPPDLDLRYLILAREQLVAYMEATDTALPTAAYLVRIWTAESTARKIALLAQSMIPPRNVMATLYPAFPNSWRIFLYYPVRMVDLVRRYSKLAWDLLRGERQTLVRAEKQDEINTLQSWLLSG